MSTLALLQNHSVEFCYYMKDLNFKLMISSNCSSPSSKERTTLSRARHLKADPRWQTTIKSQEPPLGGLLPEPHIRVCVVKCVRLMMNSLTCSIGRCPSLPHMPACLPTPEISSTAFDQTRKARPRGCLSTPPTCFASVHFCSETKSFVNGTLAFLKMWRSKPVLQFDNMFLRRFQGDLFESMRPI